MKHLFLCCLSVLFATIGTISQVEAQNLQDAESDHVMSPSSRAKRLIAISIVDGMQKIRYSRKRIFRSKLSKHPMPRNQSNIRPTMSLALITSK